MKTYIYRVAILIIILSFTNPIFAQVKDTLVKKEFGVKLSAGSQINLKGIYYTGGLYYSKKRIQYTLQYSYYGYNYVNLSGVDFNGNLEYVSFISALVGYNIPFHKWTFTINGGLNYGNGGFLINNTTYNYGYSTQVLTTYIQTNFFGGHLNFDIKYKLTNRIKVALSANAINNFYYKNDPYDASLDKPRFSIKYLGLNYGLQLGVNFKIK